MGNSGRMDSNTQASCSPRPALLRQTQAVSGAWESSFRGNGVSSMSPVVQSRSGNKREITMGNKNEGKGIFAPIVKVTRNVVGVKEFNQLRGKGIALHSQVITEFCKTIGADAKQRQGLIRLAKKNGEKLGFLA
ncbi:protein proton gradient regulation 5 [Klebsormidium nitens]|uniref:Protein proton gradient regulation 5 n=1 Tax=Klebsormidium nitens TaxID=105231 RepID=A0A1Y1HJW8_KLENI|nr:protein proton gradient regulation 5 [Klebsormidium nitens]|eukprot:GAQ78850.1 protein proton gradient regulation 5 [Klebsormidium nitens]